MTYLQRILAVILCVLLFCPGYAQTSGLDPDERSFEAISAQIRSKIKNEGDDERYEIAMRSLHYWSRHLDREGNVFNSTRANQEALQQLYLDTFPAVIQGNWHHIGPLNTLTNDYNKEGIGRVNQIYFASPLTWYAGTAGGGLWRTDEAGIYLGFGDYPWYCLTDSLPVLSISGIAVNPNNIDDVYILTGDGESMTYGTRGTQPSIGILHSPDGGATWNTTSLTYGVTALQAGYKLARYPGSTDTMFAACTDGLYRTWDGWVNSSGMNKPISTTCWDVEFKPDDPQTIYAVCQTALRRSTNGGVTFDNISNNLVQTNLNMNNIGRMAIAVTPNDPDYLYIIIAQNNGGLMSFQFSIDGGDTFIETITNSYNILASQDPFTENDGQGTYDLALWADPNNAQHVIVGGVNLWTSITGGLLWGELVHWTNDPPEYTHADVHAIESNPFNGNIVVGSDGGLYSSSDGGVEWENRGRGLGITQYYHMDVYSGFLGLPVVAGGAQDNGTSYGFGLSDPVFEMIGGGDGFRTYRGSSDGTPMRYFSVQNGKLYWQTYVFDDIWDEELITPEGELDGNDDGKGIWDTPYMPNPNTFSELLAGYGELYYSNTNGESWVHMGYPNGASYDGSRNISQIAWSKLNGNTAWFFVSDSTKRHLYKCETLYGSIFTASLNQASCTIQNLDTIAVLPSSGGSSGQPTDIALSGQNTDEVWLSFAGYTDSMKVFYNADITAGAPWVNITYNLPNTPVHCVEWDVDGIFAGTEIGAFYLPHGEEAWIYFSKGLPTVAVTEIEIENTIIGKAVFASTWGRGMWWSFPPVPVRRTRWYVDASATGIDNGANWTNAFTDLQTALDTILPGDSVWVAAGTYYPSTPAGFHTLQPNVYIWGGFNGTEDSLSQRDYNLNITILSGDIGTPGDSLDNANHVVSLGGQNGGLLLDGFHIKDGYAHGTFENSNGGGIYYSTGFETGKPVIKHCRIYHNSTFGGAGYPSNYGYGAGMYIADYASGDPEMYIIDCTFEDNHASDRGGAIYIDAYKTAFPYDTGTVVLHLDSCTLRGNTAVPEGGGIYMEAIRTGIVHLYIDNSIIDSNTVTYFQGVGGGIAGDVSPGGGTMHVECTNTQFIGHQVNTNYADGAVIYLNGSGGTINSVFTGCTFDDNHGSEGSAYNSYCNTASSHATATFEDCIFTNNTGTAGSALYFTVTGKSTTDLTLCGCTFDSNTASGRGGAIHFNGDGGGHITNTIEGCTFSNNTASENGAIRFYSRHATSGAANPGTIDATITNSLFENNTGTGASNGGAMVFWSDGSIVTANIDQTQFTGNATSSGGAIAYVHVANDSSHITAIHTDCDFINNTVAYTGEAQGGAIYLNRTNATFTGCTFVDNAADAGGAVFNYTAARNDPYTVSFTDCGFTGNHAIERGGAVNNLHDTPSKMITEFANCTFDSNYTTHISVGRGGAAYTSGTGRSEENFTGCTFSDNFASGDGGALYITNGLSLTDTVFFNVSNSNFHNNDVNTTSETVEVFGNGANSKIFTHWSNTDFHNDNVSIIFQNRKNGGVARSTFVNCTISADGMIQNLNSGDNPLPLVIETD